MDGNLYLGTSGFAYDEWKHGVFYPEGLKNREMLSYYASRFPSVEINYTFRRFPSEKSMRTWRAETPETFRFTLKANQRITHWKRLADADQDVRDFLDLGRLLGERFGTVLYQCPPTLKYDRGLIEAFVGYLPPAPRAAMEFRHPSWFDEEVFGLLRTHRAALCIADADDELDVPFVATADWGYLRLRRDDYSNRALKSWAKRIAGEGWRDVFVFFRHEDEGNGPRLAKRLEKLAG